MLPIQKRYARLLGRTLKRFKQIKSDLFNYRCPYCGDSQKNDRKARGYIFLSPEKTNLLFKCHNCGEAGPFQKLLKDHDEGLYRQYLADVLRHKDGYERDQIQKKKKAPKVPDEKPTIDILASKGAGKVSELPDDFMAVKYLRKRMVPESEWDKIFYTDQFKKFIHRVQPDKFQKITNDSPAIIFPLLDYDGEHLNGFQCRNLDPNDDLRYMTIKLSEENRFYGLHRMRENEEPTYVMEGAIDSLMLPPGALAVCGSDLLSAYFEDAIYIFDNEPRNRQIVHKIEQAIAAGLKVCLLPSDLYKMDLNDIVTKGHASMDELPSLIQNHTSSGLQAHMKFSEWRKL